MSAAKKIKIYEVPVQSTTRDRSKFGKMHEPFLKALADSPQGLTDHELAGLTGYPTDTASKRRLELTRLKLAEDSRLKRKSPAGVSAIVWRLTPPGRAKALSLQGEKT